MHTPTKDMKTKLKYKFALTYWPVEEKVNISKSIGEHASGEHNGTYPDNASMTKTKKW